MSAVDFGNRFMIVSGVLRAMCTSGLVLGMTLVRVRLALFRRHRSLVMPGSRIFRRVPHLNG